jgi:hypothetical protein
MHRIARFVVRLLGVPALWVVTLDRTDWYLCGTPLNVMVIGIAYRGVVFPVLWEILEKKGCSDTHERIALIREFGRVFGYASLLYQSVRARSGECRCLLVERVSPRVNT